MRRKTVLCLSLSIIDESGLYNLFFLTILHRLVVTALNRGTSIYLTNLLGMFDILTQQEIAKGKPYICQSNCLNITINHC